MTDHTDVVKAVNGFTGAILVCTFMVCITAIVVAYILTS